MNKFNLMLMLMAAPVLLWAVTGTLYVTVQDETGCAVSNVTVVVSALNRLGLNAGKNASDYTEAKALTDDAGKATVSFDCIDGDFEWWVESDGYYAPDMVAARLGVEQLEPDERARSEIAAEKQKGGNGGLVDWLKIFQLAEPFRVEGRSVTNAVTVLKKRRPRHLDCHVNGGHVLPLLSTATNALGFVSNSIDRIAFDLSSHRLIRSPRDYEWGAVADFWISRKCTGIPGNLHYEGRIEFAEGCGVYKGAKSRTALGPMCWEADTNRVFASTIEYSYRNVGGVITNLVPIATADEYLVLRTRAKEENGSFSEWNYSLISGPIDGWSEFSYETLLFNPTPGDTSLEHVE